MEPQEPGKKIKTLIELQRVEQEMHELRDELTGVDRRLARLEERMQTARSAI